MSAVGLGQSRQDAVALIVACRSDDGEILDTILLPLMQEPQRAWETLLALTAMGAVMAHRLDELGEPITDELRDMAIDAAAESLQ